VLRVDSGSLAEQAGFQAGDQIAKFGGQPPLSLADLQWVLHHTPARGGSVEALVNRGGRPANVTLKLPAGWRHKDDIAWRASTWELRRMGFGGMFLKPLTAEQRAEQKPPEGTMALYVQHVGQYSPHDIAKRAGLKAGDIVVSFNNRKDFQRETDVLAYALDEVKPGSKIPVEVLRDGQKLSLTLDFTGGQ
jgi:S1-C subfamily serine protease